LPQIKKIISRTFKIKGAFVFLCPKEGEERRETRDERRVSKRIKVRAIIFLNRPGQNEKSAKYCEERV
jgi:hypothetical protein